MTDFALFAPDRWTFVKSQVIGVRHFEGGEYDDDHTSAVLSPKQPSSVKEFKTCVTKNALREYNLRVISHPFGALPVKDMYDRGFTELKDKVVCQDGANVFSALYMGASGKS